MNYLPLQGSGSFPESFVVFSEDWLNCCRFPGARLIARELLDLRTDDPAFRPIASSCAYLFGR